MFAASHGEPLGLKPIVQFVFENLYDFGIREFFFVVGKTKRSIEDHFTPDYEYLYRLGSGSKNSQADKLEELYAKIESSRIVWVNQPRALGFGHAVLQAKYLVDDEPFFVHAGDTCILSKGRSIFERLWRVHEKTRADATLVLEEVADPRQYGVAKVHETGTRGVLSVRKVVEKPEKPDWKLAIMPVYVFNPSIFEALEHTTAGKNGEIQLTDAIQHLINIGDNVLAAKLGAKDLRMDIGIPETYWAALRLSYQHASR